MKGTRVGRSTISGLGLFATRVYEAGQTICEYSGKLVPVDQQANNKYLFAIDDRWTVDGSPKNNRGRWANHSCRPNAAIDVSRRKRAWIYAIRKIRLGDEITFNYGKEYRLFFFGQCKCRSCRARG